MMRVSYLPVITHVLFTTIAIKKTKHVLIRRVAGGIVVVPVCIPVLETSKHLLTSPTFCIDFLGLGRVNPVIQTRPTRGVVQYKKTYIVQKFLYITLVTFIILEGKKRTLEGKNCTLGASEGTKCTIGALVFCDGVSGMLHYQNPT